jgi:predicted amidophosphoribosyltransferase
MASPSEVCATCNADLYPGDENCRRCGAKAKPATELKYQRAAVEEEEEKIPTPAKTTSR